MESTFTFSTFAPHKPIVRKNQRRNNTSDSNATDPTSLTDMFLGVGELASRDEGLISQRSESEDRRLGGVGSTGQRQRSRGSRSGGLGSSKKKASSPNEPAPPIAKRNPVQAGSAVPGEDLVQREASTLARQQLTSSASRARPVKQQQLQQPKQSRTLRPATRQVGSTSSFQKDAMVVTSHSNNNNNDDDDDADEPIVEETGGRVVSRIVPTGHHHTRGCAEWETLYAVNQAGRLPTRSRRYLNYSAGSDGMLDPASTEECSRDETGDGDSPLGGLHADRPPSRQCHAFPTHLLDPRDFFSPNKHHDSAGGINMTPWHADEDDRDEDAVTPRGPEEDCSGDAKQAMHDFSNQRPPSRYMVKPARGGSSSSNKSSTSQGDDGQARLPSRRGAAGSRNEAAAHHYHDPKTDGFLDVDESVPPPFRVEISTEATRAQYVPSQHRRMDEERRHGLKSRRSSSFGSRSQLKHLQQQSLYAPLESEPDMARDAEVSTRNRVVEPQWFQDLEPAANKRVPETGPAGLLISQIRTKRSIVQPVASSGAADSDTNHTTHQWFRSMNNPFFVSQAPSTGAAASSLSDDMDAETAIANTPLYAGDSDLMAMTQLTDLHLDDFMGDPYVFNSSSAGLGNASANAVATSVTGVVNTASTKAASAALNTSLGRDFLSLFAQH